MEEGHHLPARHVVAGAGAAGHAAGGDPGGRQTRDLLREPDVSENEIGDPAGTLPSKAR
jgi:hypothetical protein